MPESAGMGRTVGSAELPLAAGRCGNEVHITRFCFFAWGGGWWVVGLDDDEELAYSRLCALQSKSEVSKRLHMAF
jgi:hypothetical protein